MVPKKFTSWSYSRYFDYKTCPLKAKLKYLDKIPEPANEAMLRGSAIHGSIEHYIKGQANTLDNSVAPQSRRLIEGLRKAYKKCPDGIAVEETWAFTKDWRETVYNDWSGCALRIKTDFADHEDHETLRIIDWKSGRVRDETTDGWLEQLQLSALGALLLYPHINVVKPRFNYIDHGVMTPENFFLERQEIGVLMTAWLLRTEPMLTDTRFAPRPNQFCRWCHYRADNKGCGGGQCKF